MATEDIIIRYKADVSQLEADIKKLIDAQEELLKETKAGNEEQKKVLTSAEFAAKKRLELLKLEEERLKKLQAAQKLAFDPKEIEKYNRQIDESNKKISLLSGNLEKQKQGINNFGNFASNAFSNIGIAIAAAFSIDAITNFTRNAVQEFSKLETSRVTFEVLIGNAEKAKQIFDELRAFSLTTPFATEDVQAAAKSLIAFGIDANDVVNQIKILGDVSAGTGKNINELAIIFGQIQSSGRLMGQDLLQLINAGFNPLQIISEKTGKSMAVLKKEMEKGAISSEMIADAFKTATSEGGLFFQLTDKLSKSTAGQLAELDDRTQQLSQTIGERLAPSYISFRKALLDSATTIINFFDNLGRVINENQQSLKLLIPLLVTLIGSLTRATQIKFYESLVQSVQGLKDFVVNTRLAIVQSNLYATATGRLSLAQKTAAIATTTFTKAQQALSAAIKANPIGLLLGALSTAYILYEQFSQAAQDAAKAQEQQAEAVKELDDISDSYNKKIAQEERALNTLVDAIKKAGTGTKERKDLIDQLNKQYGTTLKNIKDEKEFLDALKDSYDRILPSIKAKFLAQAGEERFTKALDQELDATLELEKAEKQRAKALEAVDKAEQKALATAKERRKASSGGSAIGDLGTLSEESKFQEQRNKINEKFNVERLRANKIAASRRVQEEENAFKRLKANAEFFSEDLIDIEKQTTSELSKEQKKAAEEREKQRQKDYQESVDNFLKLRDEADKLLKDLEFDITLNTKGLAPAIDQFQKTASTELENAINLLNLEIESNPLAFDALTNEQKLALLQKNFTEFVNQIDQKWKDGGVSIAETSENIAAALGPEFLSLPFEEALKKLPELAAQYLPQFKGQFKDTADEVVSQADLIAAAQKKAAEDYANSWLGKNEEVLKSFQETFSVLGDLFKTLTDARIQELERETNAELEALETRNKNNEEQLENRAISEREFLEQQTKIENEKTALQEEAAEKEKELKRQQFAVQQATAIFEIALSTAKAVAEISALAAVYQTNPKTAVLAVNANIQKALLIAQAAAQIAAVLAQPKPYRLGSKDTGPTDHMARVGEEGEEIVFMPHGSKVLPAKQTRKYGQVLDAMFDNKLDKYVLDNYVTPALMQQKRKFESEQGKSFADNMASSIYYNGGLNANDMERIRRKGQPITNVEELADAIAKRLPTRDIYR